MGKYWKESDCLSEPRTAVPKVLKKVSYRWCTKGKWMRKPERKAVDIFPNPITLEHLEMNGKMKR